ncbi:hypothetical protein NP233_g3486 [Leucocoprinus birnbaumii]|uniref:F-box domain-containing protein n=1 Tax=Leucocoprinus birnbaumii TaxID=56174 RepID=A0AAD5VX48_9AGAR|nr:hypothetical protein NP233_g3486 [Leucocoprinus birnbaumii]
MQSSTKANRRSVQLLTDIPPPTPIHSFHRMDINSLPTEILCKVFLFEVSRRASSLYSVPQHQAQRATELAGVYSHWRSIVISFPSLWATIQIIVTAKFPPLRHLSLWIDRSGDNLLDVQFLCIRSGYISMQSKWHLSAPDPDYFCRAWNSLTPAVDRWASLALDLDEYYLESVDFAGDLSRSLNLSELYVRHYDFSPIQMWAWPRRSSLIGLPSLLKHFSSIPALSCLTLCSATSRYPISSARDLKWSSLIGVVMNLSNSPAEITASILAQCTSTVYVRIQNYVGIRDMAAYPKKIVLPKLQELEVKATRHATLSLFGALDSPRLQILSIQISTPEPLALSDLCHLKSFLTSRQHHLSVLKMLIQGPKGSFLIESLSDILCCCRKVGIQTVAIRGGPLDQTSSADYLAEFNMLEHALSKIAPDESSPERCLPSFRVEEMLSEGKWLRFGWRDPAVIPNDSEFPHEFGLQYCPFKYPPSEPY